MYKITISFITKAWLLSAMIALTVGCGGSGESSDLTTGRGGSANSLFSLDITDAAIGDAEELWVEFTGVTLQPSNDITGENRLEFIFDTPKRINLLALQGTKIDSLLAQKVIPAGSYDWMRLAVNAEQDSVLDSYIKLNNGNEYEIYIPSGSQSGLKLNRGFELITNAEFNFTIDFDLRKSVVMAGGEFMLKPVLRLVNNAESATITGTVDVALITDPACSNPATANPNAVYLFVNANAVADDIYNQPGDPISSAIVALNNDGNYAYTLGFIPEGVYTISFTCQSDLDNPETDDVIDFTGTSNITLTAGQVLNFNF